MTDQKKPSGNPPYQWCRLHERTTRSLSPPKWVYARHSFLLVSTLLFSLLSVPLWKFISAQLIGQDLVTGPGGPVLQCSHDCSLPSSCGWGTKILFQAAAGHQGILAPRPPSTPLQTVGMTPGPHPRGHLPDSPGCPLISVSFLSVWNLMLNSLPSLIYPHSPSLFLFLIRQTSFHWKMQC